MLYPGICTFNFTAFTAAGSGIGADGACPGSCSRSACCGKCSFTHVHSQHRRACFERRSKGPQAALPVSKYCAPRHLASIGNRTLWLLAAGMRMSGILEQKRALHLHTVELVAKLPVLALACLAAVPLHLAPRTALAASAARLSRTLRNAAAARPSRPRAAPQQTHFPPLFLPELISSCSAAVAGILPEARIPRPTWFHTPRRKES